MKFKNNYLVLWSLKSLIICENLGKETRYLRKIHIDFY